MRVPGFSAEAALRATDGSSWLRARRATGRATGPEAVIPQEETCDVGVIGDGTELYIVCCDPDRHPPCVATGIV